MKWLDVRQLPCYTEGDQSLWHTMHSLAQLKYDDQHKLLLVICDGMIVGSDNDRPTPRIVLDIPGADPNLDPEPLSLVSLSQGAKQHNMGKVHSGLYECKRPVVPYLVSAKVGKPTEHWRPGNRGKHDLQNHCLNKVHFNSPMSPLELKMYQIKNVFSSMNHEKKLLDVCGETQLASAKQLIVTMMQVYEYFISHNMAKAFESLFGSVTCLPGCFTLYPSTRPPDDWKILPSQRRQWINLTVHNLGELPFLEQLCGFCCYSMQFVVMISLVSTPMQPVTVPYIVYLVLILVLRRKGDMSRWMLDVLLHSHHAVSLFMIPLYSFWKMDDFS
ncbi:chitin synthase-domain-containing protein [Mycena alexandri]|uniref:Chitin synthase-domain-containing protein n=1 Tax=Mycena alexandri TaxID=1745969 RepID=A0AAD6T380_9AGAR|nr:chitin synthase-domain-containing protein [Mycena alexandri]